MNDRMGRIHGLNAMYGGMVLGLVYLAGLGAAVGAPNVAQRGTPHFLECTQVPGASDSPGAYHVWIDRKGDGELEANLLRRFPGGLGTLELSQGTFPVEPLAAATRQSASSKGLQVSASGIRYRDSLGRFELETGAAAQGATLGEIPARLSSPATGSTPLPMTCHTGVRSSG